jgi:hypothetical protein
MIEEALEMHWDYEGLWQKARLYAHRAMAAERDGALFPFWATLSLEFLARATLSQINPCLLADPTQGGDNILYACGFPSSTPPISIKAKTVFLRCQRVVSTFTEEEHSFCMSLMQRRNEELHTSSPAFEDFPTSMWLARFFRVSQVLLTAQGHSLADLFGNDEAEAAAEMIKADEKQAKKEALDLIAAARRAAEAKSKGELLKKREEFLAFFNKKTPRFSKLIQCPACGEKCILLGKRVGSSEPRLEENEIVQEIFVLPTKLKCGFCNLWLEGHTLLHGADIGGQFSFKEYHDPVEFHQIDPSEYFDPADYYEPDYGND